MFAILIAVLAGMAAAGVKGLNMQMGKVIIWSRASCEFLMESERVLINLFQRFSEAVRTPEKL